MEWVIMNNELKIIDTLTVKNNQITVSSLYVAQVFHKRHGHIINTIDKTIQDTGHEFSQPNFRLAKYKDNQGKMRKSYNLTKDGFVFLVMGFTGKEVARFKVEYINAFNQMQQQLLEQHTNQNALPHHTTRPKPSINHSIISVGSQEVASYFGVDHEQLVNQIKQFRVIARPNNGFYKETYPARQDDSKRYGLDYRLGKEAFLMLNLGDEPHIKRSILEILQSFNDLEKRSNSNMFNLLSNVKKSIWQQKQQAETLLTKGSGNTETIKQTKNNAAELLECIIVIIQEVIDSEPKGLMNVDQIGSKQNTSNLSAKQIKLTNAIKLLSTIAEQNNELLNGQAFLMKHIINALQQNIKGNDDVLGYLENMMRNYGILVSAEEQPEGYGVISC